MRRRADRHKAGASRGLRAAASWLAAYVQYLSDDTGSFSALLLGRCNALSVVVRSNGTSDGKPNGKATRWGWKAGVHVSLNTEDVAAESGGLQGGGRGGRTTAREVVTNRVCERDGEILVCNYAAVFLSGQRGLQFENKPCGAGSHGVFLASQGETGIERQHVAFGGDGETRRAVHGQRWAHGIRGPEKRGLTRAAMQRGGRAGRPSHLLRTVRLSPRDRTAVGWREHAGGRTPSRAW